MQRYTFSTNIVCKNREYYTLEEEFFHLPDSIHIERINKINAVVGGLESCWRGIAAQRHCTPLCFGQKLTQAPTYVIVGQRHDMYLAALYFVTSSLLHLPSNMSVYVFFAINDSNN